MVRRLLLALPVVVIRVTAAQVLAFVRGTLGELAAHLEQGQRHDAAGWGFVYNGRSGGR